MSENIALESLVQTERTRDFINPHPAVISESLILRRRGQLAHGRKSDVSDIYLHTMPQKAFKGTLGTHDLTSIGSKTSHGPSMDPMGTLKWTSKFSSLFQAKFTISTLYIL